jgi:hypothetical protein
MTCTIDALAPRTRLLLEAPVLPMLLRLSAPNLAEATARVTFSARCTRGRTPS